MAEPIDQLIGHRICEWRRKAGMSKTELARQVEVSTSQIEQFETGEQRVSARLLWKIAFALNVSITKFFDGLGVPSKSATAAIVEQHYLERSETFEMLGFYYAHPTDVRLKLLDYLKALSSWKLST